MFEDVNDNCEILTALRKSSSSLKKTAQARREINCLPLIVSSEGSTRNAV